MILLNAFDLGVDFLTFAGLSMISDILRLPGSCN